MNANESIIFGWKWLLLILVIMTHSSVVSISRGQNTVSTPQISGAKNINAWLVAGQGQADLEANPPSIVEEVYRGTVRARIKLQWMGYHVIGFLGNKAGISLLQKIGEEGVQVNELWMIGRPSRVPTYKNIETAEDASSYIASVTGTLAVYLFAILMICTLLHPNTILTELKYLLTNPKENRYLKVSWIIGSIVLFFQSKPIIEALLFPPILLWAICFGWFFFGMIGRMTLKKIGFEPRSEAWFRIIVLPSAGVVTWFTVCALFAAGLTALLTSLFG